MLGALSQGTNGATSEACRDAQADARSAIERAGVGSAIARLAAFIAESAPQPPNRQPPPAATYLAAPLDLIEFEPLNTPDSARQRATNPEPSYGAIDSLWTDYLDLNEQLQAALSGVSQAQSERLHALLPRLLPRTSNGEDLETLADGVIVVEIDNTLDHGALQRLSHSLVMRSDLETVGRLKTLFDEPPPVSPPGATENRAIGEIIHADQRDGHTLLVGGPGDNVYTGTASIIIDLGGDDHYALAPPDGLRIVIDFAGDDTHTGQSAGAVLGASLLVDAAGNDTYAAGPISLGAAVAGVGVLVDHAGDDVYHGTELVQGAALIGTGTLIDGQGNDVYTATKFGQGFGGARGTGRLLDRAGDDRYVAGGRFPSSYGTPGRFQAFSQGVGMGFRGTIAGGSGMLLDASGNDRYRSGNFSQGTGYFLGLGVLDDRAGNDMYTGSRYAQGAAAHVGVGLMRDAGGNDRYSGEVSATQAAAWDQALALLLDCGGDDDYTADEFALAAAAQNAIAIFVDTTGKNSYTAERDARGHTGPTDYYDAGDELGNVAMFLDGETPAQARSPAGVASPPRSIASSRTLAWPWLTRFEELETR